jgi:hypothetical protein
LLLEVNMKKEKQIDMQSIEISLLNPAPYNPRVDLKPTDPEYQHIKNSLDDFGYLDPIVWNKRTGNIVSGHQRYKILKEQGTTELLCVVVDFDEDKEKACNLAMNKAVGLWDDKKLEELLSEMQDTEWDMSDFGFDDMPEIDTGDNETITEKSDEAEYFINNAWKNYCAEFAEQFDKLNGFSGMTKSYAVIKFIEAKYYNKSYPRQCSVIFQPHQFKTAGGTAHEDSGSAYNGLLSVAKGETNPERIRFVSGDNLCKIYSGSLPFAGYRMPLDFPVDLVRVLLRKYAPDKPNVLDPCHGWGGRLIGCMLEGVNSYTGVDPSTFANTGLRDIENTFREYSDIGEVNIISSPFETAEIKENAFDFALTSPPYFDTEKYIGGEQSRIKFDNYDAWRDGFYSKLIHKVYKALKNKTYFCLQVGSQKYPLLDDGKRIAQDCGFSYEGTFTTMMKNNFCDTSDEDGEVVIVLYKGDKNV